MYLGRQLSSGNYLKLDDLSSQFNGTQKTFNLTSGGNLFYPGSAFSILVSLGGVIQEPESAYTIDQYQITFAVAPQVTDDFFCIALGVALGVGVPGDGTVSGAKLSKPFNYNDGHLTLDVVNNRVGINSSIPQQTLDVQSGNIRVGNNTLISSGISTFSTLRATNIIGVSTAGITTAYIGAINDGPLAGARNRIINGDMRIDQRNAGAAVSVNGSFAVDRWSFGRDGGTQAVSRSTVAPAGFTNSLLYSVTTGYTPSAAHQNNIRQFIEGFNTADLGWGTASAQTVTLSFWVRSSITGTFAGSLMNSAFDRSYVFTFSVNSSNTWEYKSVSIPGDTAGTWLTDNGVGIRLFFDMGSGSSYNATAGAWTAGERRNTASSTQVAVTTGATFYITGVQLEAGTIATPFERRSYGQELALCQRYYEKSYPTDVAVGANTGNANGSIMNVAINTADFYSYGTFRFQMTKRDIPTVIFYNPVTGQAGGFRGVSDASNNAATVVAAFIGHTGVGRVGAASNNMTGNFVYAFHYSASAEL